MTTKSVLQDKDVTGLQESTEETDILISKLRVQSY